MLKTQPDSGDISSAAPPQADITHKHTHTHTITATGQYYTGHVGCSCPRVHGVLPQAHASARDEANRSRSCSLHFHGFIRWERHEHLKESPVKHADRDDNDGGAAGGDTDPRERERERERRASLALAECLTRGQVTEIKMKTDRECA